MKRYLPLFALLPGDLYSRGQRKTDQAVNNINIERK